MQADGVGGGFGADERVIGVSEPLDVESGSGGAEPGGGKAV